MKIEKKHKIIIITFLSLFAIYVISYLPRRANGNYFLTQSGELRYSGTGMSVSDIEMWSPKDCWWQPSFKSVSGNYTSRGNTLGYAYAPLIYIDRLFFYPTKEIDKKILSDFFGQHIKMKSENK